MTAQLKTCVVVGLALAACTSPHLGVTGRVAIGIVSVADATLSGDSSAASLDAWTVSDAPADLATDLAPDLAPADEADTVPEVAADVPETVSFPCGTGCDDGNPCTQDSCAPTGCIHTGLANGTACSFPGLCGTSTCAGGQCVSAASCAVTEPDDGSIFHGVAAAADGSLELAGLQGFYDKPHGWLVHVDPAGSATSTVLGPGHLGPVAVHGSGWVVGGLLDGKGAVLHLDETGALVWQTSWPTEVKGVAVAPDLGLYVVEEGSLTRTTLLAIPLWQKPFGGAGVASLADGAVVASASQVLRVDGAGGVVWTWSTPGIDWTDSVILADGSLGMLGANAGGSTVAARVTAQGKPMWSEVLYGVPGTRGLAAGTHLGLVLTTHDDASWLVRLDAQGHAAGGVRLDEDARPLCSTSAGGFVVAGSHEASGIHGWFARTDAWGRVASKELCAGIADCDDGLPCTDDTCDESVGCVHVPAPEGSACGSGSCQQDSLAWQQTAQHDVRHLATDGTHVLAAGGGGYGEDVYAWTVSAGGEQGPLQTLGSLSSPKALAARQDGWWLLDSEGHLARLAADGTLAGQVTETDPVPNLFATRRSMVGLLDDGAVVSADSLVQRVDSEGQPLWKTTVPGVVTGLTRDGDGLLLAGTAVASASQPWLARLGGNGTLQWSTTPSTPFGGAMTGIAAIPGGFRAVGHKFGPPYRGWVVFLNAAGNETGHANLPMRDVPQDSRWLLPAADHLLLAGTDTSWVGSHSTPWLANIDASAHVLAETRLAPLAGCTLMDVVSLAGGDALLGCDNPWSGTSVLARVAFGKQAATCQ